MPASKNQNYLHGAAILVVATIITKILGAIYKIPLGNILGNEGFAYFNVAYNLYNVLLALSTAGLPIALSRLISESISDISYEPAAREAVRAVASRLDPAAVAAGRSSVDQNLIGALRPLAVDLMTAAGMPAADARAALPRT